MRRPKIAFSLLLAAASLIAAFDLYAGGAQNQQTAPPRGGDSPRFAYAPITSGAYKIDPAHSSINFAVRHMMINEVRGRFTDFAGTITYDDKDVTKSSVEFTAKAASINTDVARRDEHLRTPDFFDAAKYPELIFKSKRVERRGADEYVAVGDFTMRGVTKEIAIPFKVWGAVKNPRGTRIGVEARTVLDRRDYGITWGQTLEGGGLAVSNDVRIELLLEATKQEPATAAAPAAN